MPLTKGPHLATVKVERSRDPRPQSLRRRPWWRLFAVVVAVGILIGITAGAVSRFGIAPIQEWSPKEWLKKSARASDAPAEPEQVAELVPNQPNMLRLPPSVMKRLAVQTAEVKKATEPRPLELNGSLDFIPERLAKVRARFPGEVVEIPKIEVPPQDGSLVTVSRPIHFGDRVTKGQLLAVVWNTDLGSKKSDLVDALSQLRRDEEQYNRISKLYKEGSASEAMVQSAQQAAEASLNKVTSIERTLRTWRVPEDEIKAVREEAERIIREKSKRDTRKEAAWARVEVRAPFDGQIVEMNVAPHDIVDITSDLFKVASMDKLAVRANVFEEDLPALLGLTPDQRRWRVRLQSEPNATPLPGTIEVIGPVVDPTQHTAMVQGEVDNPEGRLRVGQFIVARVELPPPADQVVIPTNALVEDGQDSIVFVQPDPQKPCYAQRRVAVRRRTHDWVYLRLKLTPDEQKAGLQTLQPGERGVISGAIEMKAALEDLQSTAKK